MPKIEKDEMNWIKQISELSESAQAAFSIRCAMRARFVLVELLSNRLTTFDRYLDAATKYYSSQELDVKAPGHPENPKSAVASAFGVLSYTFEAIYYANSDSKKIIYSARHAYSQYRDCFRSANLQSHSLKSAISAAHRDFESLRSLEELNSPTPLDVSENGLLGQLWLPDELAIEEDDDYFELHDVATSFDVVFTGRVIESNDQCIIREATKDIEGTSTLVAVNIPNHFSEIEPIDFDRMEAFRELSQHPDIVQLFDYSIEEDFLGQSNRKKMITIAQLSSEACSPDTIEQKRPLKEVAKIFTGIGKALDYLHQMGLQHLQVTPSNILRTGKKFQLGLIGMTSRNTHSVLSGYFPPEYNSKGVVNESFDLYSVAISALNLRFGVNFASDFLATETSFETMNKHLSSLGNFNTRDSEFILSAIHPDPVQRSNLLVSEWLAKFLIIESLEVRPKLLTILETLRAYTANEEPRWN